MNPHPLLNLIRIVAGAAVRNMTIPERVAVLKILEEAPDTDKWDGPPTEDDFKQTVKDMADEIRRGLQ